VSSDRGRHWRGVINQQGRVTLEADWNEAAAIAAESERAQLVDVVGPSGTPDDGYRVDVAGSGDLTIRHGTMYVGGERMTLDADLDYADQPDWVDNAGDPLWTEPAAPDGEEAVWLYLREQEVGAVEDPALLDVALGGPDTSERLRIVQRVVRSATGETSCAGAFGDLEKSWAEQGLTFDPETMRLESAATLQVSFQEVATGPTLCEPFAQGGYLGAENQLIRVQVASVDGSGAPTLVWGFDNAHFMYRISDAVVHGAAGTTTLTLASAPVDSFHQPATGQAVEVLRAAAHLTQDTAAADDYVAAATGVVTTCETAYNPDEGTVVISTALDADTTESPLLFLRVWQKTIPAAAGAVALGDTGIQVTLAAGSGTFHVGDYWQFAVRPATPTQVSPVYPERILDAPQPPDGPRLWACPLAVIAWADGAGTVTDCRNHFDDLVTLTGRGGGGCCCVDVTVDDVAGGEKLQEVIDRYARQGPATICLAPGTYTLSRPLVITADHANLTIQGCSEGVRIQVEDEHPIFVLGVILLEDVTNFTLRDLELHVPLVRLRIGATAIAGLPTDRRALAASYGKLLDCSIGVYARGGTGLRFENCTFTFGQSANRNIFGSAIFATRAVSGLEILDCTFAAEESPTSPFNALAQGLEADPPYQVRFGYAQIPTRTAAASFATDVVMRRSRVSADKAAALAASQIGVPSLADAEIVGNVFDGLTVPVLVLGQAGTVRIDDNTVRGCYGGFWLVTTSTTRTVAMLDRIASGAAAVREYLAYSQLASLSDPVLFLAAVVGRVLPLTPDAETLTGAVGLIQTPDKKLLQEAQGLFTRLYALPTFDAVLATGGTQVQPVVAAQPAVEAEPVAETGTVIAGKAFDIEHIELPPNLVGVFTQRGAADVSGLVPEADPGTALTPRIDVNGNQVDAVFARANSGAGLLVVALDTTGASSLICGNNRIRSRIPAGATVGLWSLVECAFTGNVVTNEVAQVETNRSLVLRPQPLGQAAAVAVTGNVLVGPAQLPFRPNPPPFDTWNGLNTITDYVAP
jgi:hypothetical protein